MTADQHTTRSTPQQLSRSHLFSIYNRARHAARAGKLDEARVNRALGILQSRDGAARLRSDAVTPGVVSGSASTEMSPRLFVSAAQNAGRRETSDPSNARRTAGSANGYRSTTNDINRSASVGIT